MPLFIISLFKNPYYVEPVSSGQPVLSGHHAIPLGWLLNTGLTVFGLAWFCMPFNNTTWNKELFIKKDYGDFWWKYLAHSTHTFVMEILV